MPLDLSKEISKIKKIFELERKKSGLTKSGLATKANITRATLYTLFNGKRYGDGLPVTPDPNTVIAVGRALGLKIDKVKVA